MERPMEPLLEALRQLGTKAWSDQTHMVIEGGGLHGGEVNISGGVSSQFISALLIIAPYARPSFALGFASFLLFLLSIYLIF